MLGFEVWFWNGYGFDQHFLSAFEVIAKFPRQKSSNISPYFHGENPAALRLRCIIACKTLFLPSFRHENTTMGMPHFYNENLTKFRVWCAMAHQQGFVLVYTARAKVLVLGRAGAPQSNKHVDTCHIHEETNVTRWHGSGRSHRGDYAHNMTWICTCNKCLEHTLMPQGQEHSWLERVAHVATRVHNTKCTITPIQTYINIHTSCTMWSHRAG